MSINSLNRDKLSRSLLQKIRRWVKIRKKLKNKNLFFEKEIKNKTKE